MKTKKLIVGAFLALLGFSARAQNGLENITVEKYYIANATDATQADVDIDDYNAANSTTLPHGALPAGSVTYRFYADLLPGWKILSVYADGTKSQSLVFTTTGSFYNNPLGTLSPVPGTAKTAIKNNLLALDSYYSLGAICTGNHGILKAEDNGAANNITAAGNPGGVLLNNHPDMGIPLTTQDGMIAGAGVISPSSAGFTAANDAALNDGSVLSNSFVLVDGSWFTSVGAVGPVAGTNKVLIAQITTTNGVLHYEFNLLVKNDATGTIQNYATFPAAGDLTAPGITGSLGPNTPPTVTIDSPLNGASFMTGDLVAIAASATDAAPGTVAGVEFFVDGISLSTDNSAPYTASYPSVAGTHTLTAKATDDQGAQTTSAAVIINVQNDPAPSVNITAPLNGASFTTGDLVAITANATDAAPGTVTGVEFFVDGVSLSTDNSSPYTASYMSVVGTHTLTAKATDNIGQQTTSAAVVINVQNDPLPTVAITAPANGATFVSPAVVSITATASDAAPGSVTGVEFFVDGVSLSVDNTSPYNASYVSAVGTHTLTAKATDNIGQQATSAGIIINVLDGSTKYTIGTISDTCLATGFCLPVTALVAVNDVIGYDMVIQYDKTKVQPSGVVTVSNALINPAYVSTSYTDNNALGQISISAYFNTSAPAGAEFNGLGDVLCVGFNRVGSHPGVDTAMFSMLSLEESYYTTVTPAVTGSGKYITFTDSLFHGGLRFWSDNQPIKYDISNPTQYLITNIYGNNASCNALSAAAVQPDLMGNFNYNIGNGTSVTIKRDILAATNVQPVINSADALIAQQIVLSTLVPNPSIYQMVASDVNMDGRVSAGDISQINQRSFGALGEFKQAWNYDNQGNPIPGAGASKDWIFLDSAVTLASNAYQISSTYPADNGVGYSKFRVPVAPFCSPVPMTDYPNCPDIRTEIYRGVMLGDVNGSYATHAADGQIKKEISSTDPNAKVVFDMTNAVMSSNYIDVPLTISTTDEISSFDFALQFNESNLSFHSIVNHNANNPAAYVGAGYYNPTDKTLKSGAYITPGQFNANTSLISVRFNVLGSIVTSDLVPAAGYVNGIAAKTEVTPFTPTSIDDIDSYQVVNIYPNPAISVLNVEVSQNAVVEMMDAAGRQVVVKTSVNANQKQAINVENLANGVYMMKVSNDKFVSMQKVVINK